MGGCMSAPVKAARIISKKLQSDTRQKPSSKEPISEAPKSKPLSQLLLCGTVLKDPSPDNIHDKYVLGKELGRGEFGITHKCTEKATQRVYACKTISKVKLKTEIDVEDVRREVDIMRHLPEHPNLVRFKEAFEDKEAVHLVMELCEGGELFDRIVSKGHYSERAASLVTKTILEVVKVCREHGVIHRDLKPENFLFADTSESSELKVIDFGLSIFFESGQRFNEIVGSPYYMAPEVLRRNYGPECDVWSTGVILYILLCGVPPFWADTEEGIAHAIVAGQIDFERDPWPKVSEDAKELVKSMLDQNPYSRLTVKEALEHRWIENAKNVPNISLGENVGTRIRQFSLLNKFKKKVLMVVADNLPSEAVDGIKDMFHMWDTDNNGDLSFEELKDGLKKGGHTIPDPEVKMLLDAADMDGNGSLSIQEFITMSIHLTKVENDEHLAQAFTFFDKNESGYIEYDELRERLRDRNSGPINEQAIKEILLDVDLDKDGKISYDEFRSMMKNGLDWKMTSRQYSRALLTAVSMKLLKDDKSCRQRASVSRLAKVNTSQTNALERD